MNKRNCILCLLIFLLAGCAAKKTQPKLERLYNNDALNPDNWLCQHKYNANCDRAKEERARTTRRTVAKPAPRRVSRPAPRRVPTPTPKPAPRVEVRSRPQAPAVPSVRVSSRRDRQPSRHGMIFFPAGEFKMGSTEGDADERPVHRVYLNAFYIDKWEVTTSEYGQCVKAGRCESPRTGKAMNWKSKENRNRHPINGVSWYEAKKYCAFVNKRLPSEAEWERAATWKNGRKYKYASGKDFVNCSYAVMDDRRKGKYTPGCKEKRTWSVGSMMQEINGTYDMMGNVLEWVSDRVGSYPSGFARNPQGASSGLYRVFRGGSWRNDKAFMRGSDRFSESPSHQDNTVGLRCAASP